MTEHTEVGSISEQYRDQGYENLVVNKLIDPVKNWGIAVADREDNHERTATTSQGE